jgi:hypothetical protein
MRAQNQEEKEDIEKISALNIIFEDLINDASDLVKDLFWSLKIYLFFGDDNNSFWFTRNRLQY